MRFYDEPPPPWAMKLAIVLFAMSLWVYFVMGVR